MSLNKSEKNFKKEYFTESRELLDAMEMSLLALEKDDSDSDSINSIFRSVHTIKGNSGMFGYDKIGEFTHLLENLLVCVRNGKLDLSDEMTALFLECHDFMMNLIDYFEDDCNTDLDPDNAEVFAILAEKINGYLEHPACEAAAALSSVSEVTSCCDDEMTVCNDCWHISLRFGEKVFQEGLDPYSFIRYLTEKGEIQHIRTVSDRIPEAEYMNPELCYLGFEIDFRSTVTKSDIENIFEFVKDDCEIRILPPRTGISDYVRLIETLPEKPMRIGEMLREIGSLTSSELERALQLQSIQGKISLDETEKEFVGKILVDEKMIQKPVLEAALEKQQSVRRREESDRRTIRVEAEKLDRLINLIGELVITGSNVKQISESEEKTGLVKAVNDMSKLIEEIRGSSMGIRMVQIGETFSRFERVVRDLSRERGKKINFIVMGGETELDKTLIDKLADPLIHLIRNSVDHGIGTPEERTNAGKPAVGTLTLNAFHETGSIVIEVKDDGCGLDRDKILDKAIEQGLARADQVYQDFEIQQFIFQPGFSTAAEVTNISGRGVGMDVVKKNIESLRGNVMIESEPGEGTTMRIHLPLTLAIIDGFMVRIAGSHYVLPLDMVTECTEVHRDDLDLREGGNYINLRGDVLPFMKMREFFREKGEEPVKHKVVVVEHARRKVGLIVDELVGEFQTVIKPLGKIFNRLQWISGSTILGTGEVAYILDIPRLIQAE
jgi:two-component system chemotaxis sensor kinase CheA